VIVSKTKKQWEFETAFKKFIVKTNKRYKHNRRHK